MRVLMIPLLLIAATAPRAEISAERQQELLHLLRQDCGACHGMRLRGGLGPALTPEALADKPNAMLSATITYGRATTPMPPWSRFLNDKEVEWLVHQLKRGIPDAEAP